jgi:CheY-like chemotaxis protein
MVVDDDESIRDSLALILQASGYETVTANNGFDALLQLKRRLPAIVLSDLNMPQMSGFELLSVVRRRFPQISVIAMSGAYHSGEAVPGGVIADAFYPKGPGTPKMLLRIVADLVQASAAHAVLWISKGIVQKYDGTIKFRSVRVNGGSATCFSVFIPGAMAGKTPGLAALSGA